MKQSKIKAYSIVSRASSIAQLNTLKVENLKYRYSSQLNISLKFN
jgi:hypothetical protein